jgi:hypothetical protein
VTIWKCLPCGSSVRNIKTTEISVGDLLENIGLVGVGEESAMTMGRPVTLKQISLLMRVRSNADRHDKGSHHTPGF